MSPARKTISPQPHEPKAKISRLSPGRERGASVPSLRVSAPETFQYLGYSEQRMADMWGCSRREAWRYVIAGLVDAVCGEPPRRPGRPPKVQEIRRVA